MAYGEDLADRIRKQLAGVDGVSEKKMFGGLAFLVNGHMCVAASHTGGLLARVDPAGSDEAVAQAHAELMVMRGRAMEGWISVAPEGVAGEPDLRSWIDRGLAYVRTLPPK
jgi:TfoX/Sxy family transcriptional regulator of competence genes